MQAQAVADDAPPYTRRNGFSASIEYSNDSSHIILGSTPDRKLAGIGAQYERRLMLGRLISWSYFAEFRPFLLSSDPAATIVQKITIGTATYGPSTGTGVVFVCQAGTSVFTGTSNAGAETITETTTCFRQQTLAQGASPIGFRLRLFPRRPVQLLFSSNGGYMYSTKPIPLPNAGNFNFTFSFGGGVEYFLAPRRSLRLEYLVQHYSNHYTAPANPGVDSGLIRLSYAFGH